MLAFLFVPAGEVMVGAFKAVGGGWTFHNVRVLFDSPYWQYYRTSIQISAITAIRRRCDRGRHRLLGDSRRYPALGPGHPQHLSGVACELRRHPVGLRLHRDDRDARDRSPTPEQRIRHQSVPAPLSISYNLFQHTPYLGIPVSRSSISTSRSR